METNENSAADVLAQQDPLSRANLEIRSLRAQLAEMQDRNVVEGRFAGEAPRYQLNEPGFYDDTYFNAGSVIEFSDTPNMTMVPLNDPAKRRMGEMIAGLEEGARRVALKNNRDFVGLHTDRNVLIDLARLDAKTVADTPAPVIKMPEARGQVPAMPHTDDALASERRGRGRPRKAVAVGAAPAQPQDRGSPMLAPAPSESAVVGRMVSQ